MRATSNILNQTTIAVGVTQVAGIPGSYLGMFDDCPKAMGESPIHRSSELGRNWKPPGKQET